MKQFAIEEQLNSIAYKALKGDYADALEACTYAKGYLAGIATAQDAIENDDHTLTFVLRVTEEEYKKLRDYILDLEGAIYDMAAQISDKEAIDHANYVFNHYKNFDIN